MEKQLEKYRNEVDRFINRFEDYIYFQSDSIYVEQFHEYVNKLKALNPEDRKQFHRIAQEYATNKANGTADALLQTEVKYPNLTDYNQLMLIVMQKITKSSKPNVADYSDLMPHLLGEDISDVQAGKIVYEIEHINSVDPANLTLDRSKAKKPFWKLMRKKHRLALKAVEVLKQDDTQPETLPDPREIAKKYYEIITDPHGRYNSEDAAKVMEVTRDYINEHSGIESISGKVSKVEGLCSDLNGSTEVTRSWIEFYADKAGFKKL